MLAGQRSVGVFLKTAPAPYFLLKEGKNLQANLVLFPQKAVFFAYKLIKSSPDYAEYIDISVHVKVVD